jgi:glycosyltransferase involved in cell wall biosynthesis
MKLLICTQAVDKKDPILAFFHTWIEEFARHFDEVHVICLKEGAHTLPLNVKVYSLGKEGGENRLKYLLRFYSHFRKIFMSVRVDYVFFHMGAVYNILAAPFFFLRKQYGTKFYWWKAHGHINLAGRIALSFVDRVYTSTLSGFPIETSKRHVVGQAIDTDFFAVSKKAERKREVVFVGRITPIKRIEDFVSTAEILVKEDPDIFFALVGPIIDQAYYESLRTRCKEKGLESRITFLGAKSQAELVMLYHDASIFLNTSVTHSMDKTVLEAVLSGCVPVTGNKAFREILEPYGLYLDNPTPEMYAEAIRTVLSKDMTHITQKLREDVVTSHSLRTFTERIFNI